MNIDDLLSKQELLDPELTACLEDGPLGRCLKHPLVFSLFYHETQNALFNAQLKYKQEYIKQCRRDKME